MEHISSVLARVIADLVEKSQEVEQEEEGDEPE